MRLILVVLFLVVPGCLMGLNVFGFPEDVVRAVAGALSGEKFQVQMDRLRLNPLRGLIADGVRVKERGGRELADLDRILVGLNLSELLSRKIQIEALELSDARLRIPAAGGVMVELEDVRARLLVLPGQLRLAEGAFRFKNWQFDLRGTLLHPEAFDPHGIGGGGETTDWSGLYEKLENILGEIRFEGKLPLVEVRFSGDLADLRSIAADSVRVESGVLRWRQAGLSSLRLDASYERGRLLVRSLELKDGPASFHATGELSDTQRIGSFLARSDLPLLPWIESLWPDRLPEDVSFVGVPKVEASLQLNWNQPALDFLVLGSAHIEDFSFRNVPVRSLHLDFAGKPGLWMTRGAKIEANALRASLDLQLKEGEISLRGEGEVNPVELQTWLDAGMQRVVKEMEFADPGWGKIELSWPLKNSAALAGVGKLRLGSTAMRGAWIESATSEIEIRDRAVTYSNLDVRMGDGVGTGVFVYDFGQKEVRLEKIQSTLDPAKILLWIDERIAKTVSVYRFNGAPLVFADGVVDMANPEKTKLDLAVNAPEGLEYDLLGKTLRFGATKGEVRVRGRSLVADIPSASLFGGTVALHADVSLAGEGAGYRLKTKVSNLDFAAITKLYFNYQESTGRLTGDLEYEAPFAKQTMLEGRGSVRVEQGNVFAIPVFGPFSSILNSLIPGSGYQAAKLAKASFQIGEEKIRTEDLEIIGSGFSLFGEGDLYFVADRLDMVVRLNAQGIPGLVFFPVSKLFEYVSTGTLNKPSWRPRNVPKELYGEGLMEVITAPIKQLGGVGNSQDKQAAEKGRLPSKIRRGPR